MQKYGVEHFKIECIEECDNNLAAEREKYWINFYGTYQFGYNATLGGDGTCKYDYNEIYQKILDGKTSIQIQRELGCCKDVIANVAKIYDIDLFSSSHQALLEQQKKAVICFTKDGQKICEFDSEAKAVEWCIQQGICSTNNGGSRGHIADVCKGKRKSAFGYI